MPDLARTLRAIAEDGADVLYSGALAQTIAADVQAMGGYLSADDLAAVRPREVEPLTIGYRRPHHPRTAGAERRPDALRRLRAT